ncbi:hypothetical protein J4Q44_G00179560 [Coregonus suidteri]|uniref:Uncharacterized protein n=1 Tax=Coregonus suidteri TaxID=861788 RepID=A0AAN8R439_9TELE
MSKGNYKNGVLSEYINNFKAKRKADEANPLITNTPKQLCGTLLGRADGMTKGKEIMKRVKGKLQSKPADQQSSLKFKEFLSHKIKVLETDKKELLPFGSSLGVGFPPGFWERPKDPGLWLHPKGVPGEMKKSKFGPIPPEVWKAARRRVFRFPKEPRTLPGTS